MVIQTSLPHKLVGVNFWVYLAMLAVCDCVCEVQSARTVLLKHGGKVGPGEIGVELPAVITCGQVALIISS